MSDNVRVKYLLLLIFISILTSCSQQGEDSDLFTSDSLGTDESGLSLNSLSKINQANQNAYVISGTCVGSSLVSISINSTEVSDSTDCSASSFSLSMDLSTISDSSQVLIEISQDGELDSFEVVKDSTIPQINSVSISDGSYGAGDIISISVDFTENIYVSSNPTLELSMESQSQVTLNADYVSGSGSSTLIFQYIVMSGDGDQDGVELSSSFDLSVGSLVDNGDNLINNLHVDTNFSNVLVDSNGPVITSFIEPANGTYSDSGGVLLFQVNFSEDVVISGTPRIALNIGGQTKYATYQSGSGTSGLEFSYTIQSGDDDSDGIELESSSIDLNGGSVKASLDADNSALSFLAYLDSMNSVLVDTSSGITPPDQVSGVSTAPTTSSSALALTWGVPADNGTSIINYTVQYREQGSSTWINVNPSPSVNSTIVSGLSSGVTYEFRVAANNGLLGSYSSVSTAEIFDVMSLNPIAWLSATNITNGGTEPSHGDKIASWSDLTGNATDAIEADVNNQPTYETNVVNGLPAVKFDGTLARGLEGTFERSNNAGLTIVVVGQFTGSARRAFFEFYKTGGGTSQGSPRGFFFTYGFNNATSNYNLTQDSFNVWSAYDTGSNTDFWENGSLVYSNWSNWGNTSFTGSGTYVLGDDQTGGDQLNGYIAEFLIFDRQLTVDERNTLESYLRNKWGTP